MRISDWSSDVCSSDLGLPTALTCTVLRRAPTPLLGHGLHGVGRHSGCLMYVTRGRGWPQRDMLQTRAHRLSHLTPVGTVMQSDGALGFPWCSVAGSCCEGGSAARRVGHECVSTC